MSQGHENAALGWAPPTEMAGDGGQCPPYDRDFRMKIKGETDGDK